MKFTKPEIIDAFHYAEMAQHKDEYQIKRIYGNSVTIIDPLLKGKGDVCYLINEGERVILAFAGSNDVIDWVLNLYKIYKDKDGILEGFKIGIDLLADEIITNILNFNPQKLLITGPSRGGGLSDVFLELYASKLSGIEIDCITFEQPKVFTQEFYDKNYSVKNAAHVKYLRVYMANDLVPQLPLTKWGYVHKGESLMLGKKISWWKQLYLLWKKWHDEHKFILLGIEEHRTDIVLRNLLRM